MGLTAQEAAEALGLKSPSVVYALLTEGRLTGCEAVGRSGEPRVLKSSPND
jgi:hypothetical protein